jgi:hypothetical protein
MEVVPYKHKTLAVGDESQIEILGAFDDGYDRMIPNPALGMSYSITEGNGIVSVSPEGIFTALKTGEAAVTVRNGKLSAVLNVSVIPSDVP